MRDPISLQENEDLNTKDLVLVRVQAGGREGGAVAAGRGVMYYPIEDISALRRVGKCPLTRHEGRFEYLPFSMLPEDLQKAILNKEEFDDEQKITLEGLKWETGNFMQPVQLDDDLGVRASDLSFVDEIPGFYVNIVSSLLPSYQHFSPETQYRFWSVLYPLYDEVLGRHENTEEMIGQAITELVNLTRHWSQEQWNALFGGGDRRLNGEVTDEDWQLELFRTIPLRILVNRNAEANSIISQNAPEIFGHLYMGSSDSPEMISEDDDWRLLTAAGFTMDHFLVYGEGLIKAGHFGLQTLLRHSEENLLDPQTVERMKGLLERDAYLYQRELGFTGEDYAYPDEGKGGAFLRQALPEVENHFPDFFEWKSETRALIRDHLFGSSFLYDQIVDAEGVGADAYLNELVTLTEGWNPEKWDEMSRLLSPDLQEQMDDSELKKMEQFIVMPLLLAQFRSHKDEPMEHAELLEKIYQLAEKGFKMDHFMEYGDVIFRSEGKAADTLIKFIDEEGWRPERFLNQDTIELVQPLLEMDVDAAEQEEQRAGPRP